MGRGSRCGPDRSDSGVRFGVGMFVEDGAYTTLASAVAVLVALTLTFSSVTAVWTASRSQDIQVVADSASMAGSNVVASYHTAATVVDACILSLGLTGFAMAGAGLAGPTPQRASSSMRASRSSRPGTASRSRPPRA